LPDFTCNHVGTIDQEEIRKMRRIGTSAVLVFICLTISICSSWPVHAQQADAESETAEQAEQAPGSGDASVEKLEDVVVTGKRGTPGLETVPSKTVIEVDDFSVIGPTGNVQDLLKTQAIIDFRGDTDLVPDSDTLTMRGFDSKRFVMAVDGLTIQKTGGRKGSHIVDYSLLSSLPIETIEIIAGPHSALFDSKSIGGVVNVMTRPPKRRDTLKPDAKLSASYGSYNTQNYKLNLNGAVGAVTYGAGVNKNTTDGYLRNNKTDIETYSGGLGLLLPYEGYINVSSTVSDIDRQATVTNTGADYDSDYPVVEDCLFDPWQEPTWDKESWATRLDYQQNLPIGRLTLGAYNSMEDRERAYYRYIDSHDPSLGVEFRSSYTRWRQKGGKLQDDYRWTGNHASTIGFDYAKLYDGKDVDERIEKKGAYFQHQWNITSYLDTKLGVRNEDVTIWVSNSQTSGIPNRGKWIERNWNEWVPKSYTTVKMDPLAGWLRDTSFSLGISKIWRAPDNHGDYNPQGKPAGAWLEPEHGMGYDLVLNRRLWQDISLMVDYSFCRIEDYIVSNKSYARYSGGSAGDLRYSDYKLNLEEVHRHGVELSRGGHRTDDLSFYLTYGWQKYDNQGDEPAGRDNLDDQAEHRGTAGLRYQLFDKTALMLDYYYQSKETKEISELIDDTDPDNPIYNWRQVDNPAYNLFHFAAEQTLFRDKWHIKDARLQFYIKNLFDEEYYDSRGYPATDRTFGVTLNARI
jgi:iron complex outermembrane receptor protein